MSLVAKSMLKIDLPDEILRFNVHMCLVSLKRIPNLCIPFESLILMEIAPYDWFWFRFMANRTYLSFIFPIFPPPCIRFSQCVSRVLDLLQVWRNHNL